jgi:hypothetical protein
MLNNSNGFLKKYISVNIKPRKIISMNVIKENIGNRKIDELQDEK